MSMVDAYKAMWKNYAKFSGRARRSEYWWVILAQTLISTAFSLINICTGGCGQCGYLCLWSGNVDSDDFSGSPQTS